MSNKNVLEKIKDKDALSILKRLIKDDPTIKEKVEKIFLEQLQEFDYEDIASSVQFDLEFLDVHDLWNRSGSTQYGYVEPCDEAVTMVEEIIEQYMGDLKRYLSMQLLERATQYCIGIIVGLYKFDKETKTEFRDWAEDVADCVVDDVFSLWKNTCHDPQLEKQMKKLLKKECPEWSDSFWRK